MKKSSHKKPTAIDLFSGCGGLTLGLKQAGFKVLGAVEIDSLAAETYLANHPEVTLWEKDIRKVKGADILRRLKIKKVNWIYLLDALLAKVFHLCEPTTERRRYVMTETILSLNIFVSLDHCVRKR